MIERLLLVMPLVLATAACGETRPAAEQFAIAGYRYSEDSLTQYLLPKALKEISGLALDTEGRLYAHDDERPRIYQIDYAAGEIIGRLELEGAPRDDFEGIAATPAHLYLTTSTGTLYESDSYVDRMSDAGSKAAGAALGYTRYAATLPCEVEGLAHLPAANRLVLACKNLRNPDPDVAIELYFWSIAGKVYEPRETMRIPWVALGALPGKPKRLQPTGIELTADGNYLLLAGKQRLLLEISPSGELIRAARLPGSSRHPQTEGIAFTAAGGLLLADEAGSGGGKDQHGGRLSVYQPEP